MNLKLSMKVCTHDKVIFALSADKDKYLNYETPTSANSIGNVCERFHDSEIRIFGVLTGFNITDRGYAKVTSLEMITLKENANTKLLVSDECLLLPYGSGNRLPVDRSYRHLSGISTQMKAKGKIKAYCWTNVIMHILAMFQNCKLCRNDMTIDSEIESKIKRALAYNITKEYKDKSMKKKCMQTQLVPLVAY